VTERDSSNEIRIVRIYDAPVDVVWDAWTDPAQVAKWWGPRGFTLTTHSKSLEPGGIWHYTMHGPDGTDWPNKTKYLEVERHARLVYDHGGNDERAPLFRVTVTFTEHAGKTKMDMRMALATPEAARETKKFIRKAGGDSTWDRLAEHLAKARAGAERFVINRTFEASIETVFAAWTDPEQLTRWMPPTGFSMKMLAADIRPGGSSFYVMTNGDDVTMYGRAAYLEIERPTRLVYTQQFCDERNDEATRHPHAPTWPETMRTVVTFAAEAPDLTRVTVEWEPVGAVTAEELATFVSGRAGMTGGWTGSFDKLEAYLAGGAAGQ
jgi:uncharacterized protein YndB with AHSA1/START domain